MCVYIRMRVRVRVCASRGSMDRDRERNVCECERNRSVSNDGSFTADDRSETYNIRDNKIRKRIVSSSFVISNLNKITVITGTFFFFF